MTNITISISCDPHILPSKDLVFFVCVACASIKQIVSALFWILSILQKQKQYVSVMESSMALMPFHICVYNGVWLWYMSLPVKWQKQSYCNCLCIWDGQMIICSDFAKSMFLPCNSKNTVRFLTLVKQKFDRLPFLHHLPRDLYNPLVLKSSGLKSKVFCCA